jgi:putative SOS response-associated peptidase YedK
MCGRVRTPEEWSEIKADQKIRWGAIRDGGPRYNVLPMTVIDVIRYDAKRGGNGIEQMRWGLIPGFVSDPKKFRAATFNAPVETIDKANTFKGAWGRGQRCLIPVDHFYEWRQSDKQPFAIAMANKSVMILAGLWEKWRPRDGSDPILSFAIVTLGARGVLGDIHDRAPAIIDPENWDAWLGSAPASNDDLFAMLEPIAAERLVMWPVSKALENVKNEAAERDEPVDAEKPHG